MRYGMCTDIATSTRDRVEYPLLEKIKDAGFDYVEFPLMMIDTLSDEDFDFCDKPTVQNIKQGDIFEYTMEITIR